MRLSILYRTHPGHNEKSRPVWSNRAMALRSLRQALGAVKSEVTVTFVVDGGLPAELEPLIRPGERIELIRGGSAASSLRACVDVGTGMARLDPPDTLYWFAEDDYLYRPQAIRTLLRACDVVPTADYLTLYTADSSAWYREHKSHRDLNVPSLPGGPVTVDNSAWNRVRGTTSTFGVRRDALLEDARLIKLATRAGAPFDGTTWHSLQGVLPYNWRYLFADLDGYLKPRGIAKVVAKPLMRSVLNAEVLRKHGPDRLLIAPERNLAMHLETAVIPENEDWYTLAGQIEAP